MVDTRLILQRIAAEGALGTVGTLLADAGLEAVVMKGAWLLADVYGHDNYRPTTDVDLVVAPSAFRATLDQLVKGGFSVVSRNGRQAVLMRDDVLLPIDLHRALFPVHTFALSAEDVVVRSTPSGRPGIRYPAALDGFAHLVGHFANDRLIAPRLAREGDFRHIAERFALNPSETACHLLECGMGCAVRYVFGLLRERVGGQQAFATAVLEALPRDAAAAGTAFVCRRVIPYVGRSRWAGAALTCLLQPDMRTAILSARGRFLLAYDHETPV